jgi:hypothetical protein
LEAVAVWTKPEEVGVVKTIIGIAPCEAKHALVVVETDHEQNCG